MFNNYNIYLITFVMVTIKRILILLIFLSSISLLKAQQVIPLYSGKAPGSEHWDWQEAESHKNISRTNVVYNVVVPTLIMYAPAAGTANGTAIVICPGGGFHTLYINNEGIDVAKWLNKKGVTAFVLKYRVVRSLTDDPIKELSSKMTGDKSKLDNRNDSVVTMAVADGKKAIEYVRSHAKEYGISTNRIGIMGFSAGGTVTMGVGFTYTPENRPDFLAPIYPYIAALKQTSVPADAPPIFICTASDDNFGMAPQSVKLYSDWLVAKKSAELHMYAKGGHGFSMRKQNLPVDYWIDRFGEWLAFEGLLNK
jgi:acetyl esterase/lipase